MDAPVLDYVRRYKCKKLALRNDSDIGRRAVVATHSTALGSATGGTRRWTYASEREAITDALRVAHGMTYKYAAAGVDLGGGNAAISGDPKKDKSDALLKALGHMVDQLADEFQTGEAASEGLRAGSEVVGECSI